MSDQIGGAISSIMAMSAQGEQQAHEAAAATQDSQHLEAWMQEEVAGSRRQAGTLRRAATRS